ncbi:MAG: 30S ribosomal protein S1 [Proteobacteria bacterium]|nr:30S ribosomal protein S1 [Pseudomonadota bacterium]
MKENFAKLFEESISNTQLRPGAVVTASVVSLNDDYVTINAGLKSEGLIRTEEFRTPEGAVDVKPGDEVEVVVETLEDGFGYTVFSREKAKRFEAWRQLEKAYKAGETVIGVIIDKVKGGFTVEVNKVRAFLPGSLVDVRPIRDTSYLEGKPLEFKVIKMDVKRNNIVVSRRAVVQAENTVERQSFLETLQEGQEVKGVVKNLTDYGAFIDLGGIDGLLHITDISWKRVKHPNEVLNVGDEIGVVVLKYDRERNRVSLGMKQLGDDPWRDIAKRYPVSTRLKGKVTNITDYGCFAEIEDGIEGLVHMSEMDWTNKNIHPSKVVSLGDMVDVVVLEIDEERRRISLGMKQCVGNPWESFAATHQKGEKIVGAIKSITDFGIFIGLDGSIDGLVHLSDISWDIPGEEAVVAYKKGQEVEAVILAIDAERERISLGIKQLTQDPFNNYLDLNPKGTAVKGKVTEVSAKQVTIELASEVQGTLKAADASEEKVSDLSEIFKVGDEVESKIVNVDKKSRQIQLSIKALHMPDEPAPAKTKAKKSKASAGTNTTSLGDILKETMDKIDSQGE